MSDKKVDDKTLARLNQLKHTCDRKRAELQQAEALLKGEFLGALLTLKLPMGVNYEVHEETGVVTVRKTRTSP